MKANQNQIVKTIEIEKQEVSELPASDFPEPQGIDPVGFRRLDWNEVVCAGDFVSDEELGLIPWEGPGGFRSHAFVKVIYRKLGNAKSINAPDPSKSKQNGNGPRRVVIGSANMQGPLLEK